MWRDLRRSLLAGASRLDDRQKMSYNQIHITRPNLSHNPCWPEAGTMSKERYLISTHAVASPHFCSLRKFTRSERVGETGWLYTMERRGSSCYISLRSLQGETNW